VSEGRRRFLRVLGASAVGLAGGARGRARAVATEAETRPATGKGRYGIAYTSFAVRLQRGRDLIRGAGAPALAAEPFLDLCRSFGADGCQMDMSQLASTESAYLDGLWRRLDESRLFLELSVDSKALEDEDRFAEVAAVARKLGAARLRIALLHGRRYEDFQSMGAWREFADHWRGVLPRARRALDQHRLEVGIENHKDWRAEELVELIRSVGSPYLGACVDFGNNISLLEDPLDTARMLAPYAVTTHLKDMAVRPYDRGFELAEVPLGTGLCPLAKMIEVLRAARPEVPLCLEMITRDPLKVPYRDDAYWASHGGRDAARIARFEATVLSRASAAPLPRVSGLGLEAMQAQEDENVRRSTAFARETLGL
jgi:sugar phosphate isomerase/epimerase